MKGFVITFLCLTTFSVAKAQLTLSVNQITGDQSVFTGIKSNSGKTLKYDEIQGSPYFDRNFAVAKVSANYELIPVRYNSYKDEVEFMKGNELQVLPKEANFSRIEINSSKLVLVLDQKIDQDKGYFFELVTGPNTLLKKVKTKFTDVVPPPNSYASEKPASFTLQSPVYYLKSKKGYHKIKNLKSMVEEYPDLKETLETFVKSNKIKFDNEDHLIKLTNFLNSK